MTIEWAKAVRRGDVAALEQLLARGADINALDEHGQTALMCASHKGKLDIVQLLVDRGASLNHRAKYNLTAVMLAVIAGHSEIARVLVTAGADMTVKGSRAPGFAGKTAMDLARDRGDDELTAMLTP